MQFGIRNAKVKVFRSAESDDNLDPVDAVNKFLEAMKINSPKETDNLPSQANHVAGSEDKSAKHRLYINVGALDRRRPNHQRALK